MKKSITLTMLILMTGLAMINTVNAQSSYNKENQVANINHLLAELAQNYNNNVTNII